jgi:hypothetical protein
MGTRRNYLIDADEAAVKDMIRRGKKPSDAILERSRKAEVPAELMGHLLGWKPEPGETRKAHGEPKELEPFLPSAPFAPEGKVYTDLHTFPETKVKTAASEPAKVAVFEPEPKSKDHKKHK